MTAKFQVGDKVLLNGRNNKYVYSLFRRSRARTIVKIFYHPELQANIYYVGNNHHGDSEPLSCIGLRSYQLRPVTGKRGRPKTRRQYIKSGKYAKTNSIVKIPAALPDTQKPAVNQQCDKTYRPPAFDAILDEITMYSEPVGVGQHE